MTTNLTATLSAAALCLGAAGAIATGSASAATAAAGPPVIHERFTPLQCTGTPAKRTTLQMEGCAEHLVLAHDRTIDALARQIYAKLPAAGRASFRTASTDWLAYRNSFCSAAAAPAASGTEAPVIDAQCLASQDSEHISDLRTFLQDSLSS